MARVLIALAAVLVVGGAHAQSPVVLRETVAPGDCVRVDIALAVDGKLIVDRNGKSDAIPLSARASVAFSQRAEAVTGAGRAGRVVRHYFDARSASDTGLEHSVRSLGAEHRVVAASRVEGGGLVAFSPGGPLTREELELVGDHFDTTALPGLLPPGAVAKGATWPIPADVARQLLHFDAHSKAELVGTLAELTDEAATITVAGSAEGVELGAVAKVKVVATAMFDRKAGRVTKIEWTQDDVRAQGPASPATELTAKVTATRSVLAAEPAELAAGRGKVPADGKPTGANAMLRYEDDKGRYRFLYPREWHVVGRTADHLTLRLIEGGEFVAQATVTAWKSAAAGSHTTPADFQAVLAKLPGWVPSAVGAAGEVPTDAGRWLYRVAATGSQDGVPVAQTFYLLAGPNGDQVAVTVVAKPEALAKLGARDAQLVNGVEFPARK